MQHAKKTILLIGGGTGGHILPIARLYQKLSADQKLNVYIIGSNGNLERTIFGGNPDFHTVITGKLNRRFTLQNVIEFCLSVFGLFHSLVLISKLKPDLIFIKGGFVALPFAMWARILKIPYLVHESDTVMGQTNRFAASGARKVFTGFPKKYYDFIPRDKLIFSGEIINEIEKPQFDFGFGNPPAGGSKPVILLVGGSQGAKPINQAIQIILPELLRDYNLIHQTGSLGFNEAIDRRAKLPDDIKPSYFVADFLGLKNDVNLMAAALNLSDIVVSRAGATAMAEIALYKKPMILIPYRYASGKHQEINAEALQRTGGAAIIRDKELSGKTLIAKINSLLKDKDKMKSMAKNAFEYWPKDGLKIIYEEILKELS